MVQCSSPSLLAATKPQFRWQQDTRNITQSICRWETSQILFGVLMEVQYFLSHSSLSPKVCVLRRFSTLANVYSQFRKNTGRVPTIKRSVGKCTTLASLKYSTL